MRDQRRRLNSLDETSTNIKMVRLCGRTPKGDRMNSAAPFGRWGTQIFVVGIKCDGLVASWIVNAPINWAIFDIYIETQLDV